MSADLVALKRALRALAVEPRGIKHPWDRAQAIARARARNELRALIAAHSADQPDDDRVDALRRWTREVIAETQAAIGPRIEAHRKSKEAARG